MSTEATALNSGQTVPYTPSGADIAAGEIVPLSGMVGIAPKPIADGVEGDLFVQGAFTCPAKTTDDIDLGDELYWDDTQSELTLTSTSNTLAGRAGSISGTSSSSVVLLLNH